MLSFLIAQGFLPAFLPCLLSYLARLRLCLFHLFLRRSRQILEILCCRVRRLSCLNWLFCFSSYEFGHLLLQGPRTSEKTADRPCDLCTLWPVSRKITGVNVHKPNLVRTFLSVVLLFGCCKSATCVGVNMTFLSVRVHLWEDGCQADWTYINRSLYPPVDQSRQWRVHLQVILFSWLTVWSCPSVQHYGRSLWVSLRRGLVLVV